MISSVIYAARPSEIKQNSTFNPSTSPVFQIIAAKVAVIVLTFILGDILPQILATIVIAVLAAVEFWITKNLGRLYLQAGWSIDTEGEQDVWIYEANFKSPSQFQQIFWYSQVFYGVLVAVAIAIIISVGKFSLACALVIAFAANYANFYAFGKIIGLRNSGVLQKIADQAQAKGEERETIKLPMVHRSKIGGMASSNVLRSQKSQKL